MGDDKKKAVAAANNDLRPNAIYRKDWNQIEKLLDQELKEEAEAALHSRGEESLRAILKEIYEKGDEDTRRAMIKSMSTSNGTVLSTQWSEVKDADYSSKGEMLATKDRPK